MCLWCSCTCVLLMRSLSLLTLLYMQGNLGPFNLLIGNQNANFSSGESLSKIQTARQTDREKDRRLNMTTSWPLKIHSDVWSTSHWVCVSFSKRQKHPVEGTRHLSAWWNAPKQQTHTEDKGEGALIDYFTLGLKLLVSSSTSKLDWLLTQGHIGLLNWFGGMVWLCICKGWLVITH